ncbi:hypothetical protein TWF696_005794 [Orbilia brochopaga]|uniref:Rhodopsin domain-containing protein n=1 Tax=Orbilia brochopaga TaxID=3140254 RepID=A0AAV9V0Q2_9PEZI
MLNSTETDIHDGFPSAPHAHNPLLSEWISPEIIASWPPPNFIDPETKHAQMFGWELALLGVAVLAVVLRIYVRICMVRPFWSVGKDDWGIGVALLFAIGLTAVQLNATQYGYGLHIWDVRHEWIMPMRKMAFCAQILFILCTTTTKLSILYFYLRLSASPTFRRLVYLGMLFVLATGVSFLFVIVFQCRPISGFWDLTLADSRCIDESAANIANAVLNSVSDLYVFLLPIKDLLGLQLPLRQRISLVILFSLGAVVCVAGWLRIWQLASVLRGTYDNTWYGPTLYILTAVECDIAIVCGCLPALKPLMAKFIPGLRKFSLRRLSGGVLVGHDGSGRRSSGGGDGKDSDSGGSGGDCSQWKARRGAVSGMGAEHCPYSDPSKKVDLTTLLAAARPAGKGLAVGSANWSSNSSIPLYEHMVRSTNRLHRGLSDEEKGDMNPESRGEGSGDGDVEEDIIAFLDEKSKGAEGQI